MSLADYLAKNYLTADTAPPSKKKSNNSNSKKRKRKGATEIATATSGLIIADDNDDDDILHASTARDGAGDDYGPVTLSSTTGTASADFRKSKKNAWKTVGVPAPSSAEQLAADKILASAAAEQDARQAAENEDDNDMINNTNNDDIVNNDKDDDDTTPRMASGARAGLQTAAQVSAAVAAHEAQVRREQLALLASTNTKSSSKDASGKETNTGAAAAAAASLANETIYRDASGRIINIAMKRAEARRAADETARRHKAEVDARKGDVQEREKAQRRAELEEAKYMPVARGRDDADMNERMRERERWEDPALGFLTRGKKKKEKKKRKGKGRGGDEEDGDRDGDGDGDEESGDDGGNRGKSVTGLPLYAGAAPPNRYGIKPGHRWDGVDRGNGFEREYFKARNRRENAETLEYAWQMDE